jgi:hypothetical protein
MNRLVTHGVIVAAAMLLFAGFALGSFGLFGWPACVVWGAALIAGGFTLRRTFWKDSGTALNVLGLAVLISFLGIVGLAHLGDTYVPWSKALSAGWQVMAVHYLPFFWLPFGLGLLAGGLHRRNRLAEQAVSGNRR